MLEKYNFPRPRDRCNVVTDPSIFNDRRGAHLISPNAIKAIMGESIDYEDSGALNEVVAHNTSFLEGIADITEFSRGDTIQEEVNGIVSTHEQFLADMYVDSRDGKILGIDYGNNKLDMEVMYGKFSVLLTLEVIVKQREFIPSYSLYGGHTYFVTGPLDKETGEVIASPRTLLKEEALMNLEMTLAHSDDS